MYHFRLIIRILLSIFCATATGFCLSRGWYGPCLVGVLLTVFCIRRLYNFLYRTVKDMKRLTEAIHFSEFNISFKNMTGKGLSPELMPEMEASIAHFNSQLQKKVSEQNFYDTLLNRIDFGLIVVDTQGVITWINKMALDMLGKPQPKTLADLENVSQGLSETLDNLIPNETHIIQIHKGSKEHRMVATAVYFIAEGKHLKIVSLKNIQTVLDETESDAWKKLIRVLMHEIMNSLTPIISLSETFARPDDENREMLGSAMQAIHRRSSGLVDFVNNYRQLTHIPLPVMSPFAAQEWLADLHRLLAADNYSFSYAVTPVDMTILADRILMDQVMINLVKNACESSDSKRLLEGARQYLEERLSASLA